MGSWGDMVIGNRSHTISPLIPLGPIAKGERSSEFTRNSLSPHHPNTPTPTEDGMRINAERLHENLRRLAQIGATPGGGVTRLALSPEDRAARDLLCRWMEEAGLRVRVDDFGNITGRRAGAVSGAAVVMASHIDTVRRGGRYDG